MVKMELYVIKDVVADDCGPVFQAVNEGVAKRQFKGLMRQNKVTDLHDYELWRIGYFSTSMELIPELTMVDCSFDDVLTKLDVKRLEAVND